MNRRGFLRGAAALPLAALPVPDELLQPLGVDLAFEPSRTLLFQRHGYYVRAMVERLASDGVLLRKFSEWKPMPQSKGQTITFRRPRAFT